MLKIEEYMKVLKKILKILGAGLIAALIVHESKALYEIKKDNLKLQHWLNKGKENVTGSK